MLKVPVIVLLGACARLSACVTEGPPPRPAPKPLPAQPPAAVASRMAFSVGNPADTDNNGYLDSMQAVAFLYADSHPISLVLDGTFEFTLVSARGEVIRAWRFDLPATRSALIQPLPGPAYAFRLGLLDAQGTDRIDGSVGELRCTFVPTSGTPVSSGRGHSVQVGRIR
ncbi:MAG: hypothetical protein ACT4PL_09415 [Phycisphaerales bacterium]